MSSSESFKYTNGKQKVYYHLRCKNTSCKGYGYHYNTKKIDTKSKRILEELTIFMLSMDNEIITCNSTKSNDVKEIDKLNKKKITFDPDNSSKEYIIELVKKLDCIEENDKLIFTNI